MIVKLSRAQLHELVWSRPITTLAAEFSLSDVALHKICRKHDIPTPPAGHWAKKTHGKPVTVKPLPKAKDGTDLEIPIREGAGSDETEAIANARAEMRSALDQASIQATANPIVERTLASLRKARPDRDGIVRVEKAGLIKMGVRPASIERAGTLLGVLIATGEAAGLALEKSSDAVVWRCAGEAIAFELVEVADQVEHMATPQELAAVAKWERERDAQFKRTGYLRDWGEPTIPKWEQRYQGRLAVRLEEVRVKSDRNWWGAAIMRTFADSRTRDVAKAVPRILVTVAAMAAAKRGNREFEARQEAQRAEAERQRVAAETRRRLEAKLVTFVDQLLSEQVELDRMRALIGTVGIGNASLAPRTSELMRWTKNRAELFTQRLRPEALEQRLLSAGLFEEIA